MIALADQSTMPLWSPTVWAILILAAVVVWFRRALRHHGPRQAAQKPAVTTTPYEVCQTTGCHYQARTTVQSFTGPVRVCRGCADEGIAHGWFTAA